MRINILLRARRAAYKMDDSTIGLQNSEVVSQLFQSEKESQRVIYIDKPRMLHRSVLFVFSINKIIV